MIVTTPDDVTEALAPLSQIERYAAPVAEEPEGEAGRSMLPPDESDRSLIVDALGPTPAEFDDVIRHTGLSASLVYLVLVERDIAGRLHRHPGGVVSLAICD
jgi:DNA processing protein